MVSEAIDWRTKLPELLKMLDKKLDVDSLGAKLGERPCRNTLIMVGLCTVAFYAAEREKNPEVNEIWDALEYCTSSLNVGYTDVYPESPMGKIIGSLLMTFGPSMVTKMTDASRNSPAARAAADSPPTASLAQRDEEILATLRAILAELQAKNGPAANPAGA